MSAYYTDFIVIANKVYNHN